MNTVVQSSITLNSNKYIQMGDATENIAARAARTLRPPRGTQRHVVFNRPGPAGHRMYRPILSDRYRREALVAHVEQQNARLRLERRRLLESRTGLHTDRADPVETVETSQRSLTDAPEHQPIYNGFKTPYSSIKEIDENISDETEREKHYASLSAQKDQMCSNAVFNDNGNLHFICPHCYCGIQVHIRQVNCAIFRHAIFKHNNQPIAPHMSKKDCEELLARGLIYGCTKPLQLVRHKNDEYTVRICGYI